MGRVNDQSEVACWLTLEADALSLRVFEEGSGSETIGTLQRAGIEPCTSRGKGAMIGFHSLHLGDTLHAHGQVDSLVWCQLHSFDKCFPHIDL